MNMLQYTWGIFSPSGLSRIVFVLLIVLLWGYENSGTIGLASCRLNFHHSLRFVGKEDI